MNRRKDKKNNIRFFKKLRLEKYNGCEYLIHELNSSKNILFYIHGGSFVEKPLKIQLDFINKVAESINADLIIPLYKTLPAGNCLEFINQTSELYEYYMQNKKIYLIGDSAGGGAALSLSYVSQ